MAEEDFKRKLAPILSTVNPITLSYKAGMTTMKG